MGLETKKAIIVHGWQGNPNEGWLPWLKRELESIGWEATVPTMPDTMTPTQGKSLKHLHDTVGEPDENTFLVGHSLGCITILRYLESLPQGQKIGGAVLVAGFPNDLRYDGYEKQLASFFTTEIDWEVIKSHCDTFFVLHTQDDKWVDIDNYYELREKLSAKGELQNGFGHYSGDDGVNELPIVLETLRGMSK